MDLTPLDVKKQEFRRVVRGYDPLEVRQFLEQVVDAWEGLIRAQQETTGKVAELGETIEHYRRIERTLNETLLAAQRIAEESRDTSLKEAEIIRKEAEMEGRRAVERAEAEARSLRHEIRELQVERDHLFLRLESLLEDELLRLRGLREAHAQLPPPHPLEPHLEPPELEPAEQTDRRAVLPPPAGVRELLHRPVGLARATSPATDETPARRGT